MHDQRLSPTRLALELSSTPCFSKVLKRPTQTPNRFSGFGKLSQTAKAVHMISTAHTPRCKRGINEISLSQLKFAAIEGHHLVNV